ncbi:hypothetical protein [Bradyrhizobium sp. ORS 111]|uniref:hypothetical protein n=1 Tax=Bradyrhizobium sp. ORS 111 TaxID=1685958 RepID=UPI003890CA48
MSILSLRQNETPTGFHQMQILNDFLAIERVTEYVAHFGYDPARCCPDVHDPNVKIEAVAVIVLVDADAIRIVESVATYPFQSIVRLVTIRS